MDNRDYLKISKILFCLVMMKLKMRIPKKINGG